jgi:hypothetical protein
MGSLAEGKVRYTGRHYANGFEGWSIDIPKGAASALNFVEGRPVPTELVIGDQSYLAHVHARTAVPVVWISPRLQDGSGARTTLSRVLRKLGIVRNQTLILDCDHGRISISTR